MGAEEISEISIGEFETVSQLLSSSESLQFAFILMIVGMIAIAIGYSKFSNIVKSNKIFYTRPHLARFIRRAVLPFFAIGRFNILFFNFRVIYINLFLIQPQIIS